MNEPLAGAVLLCKAIQKRNESIPNKKYLHFEMHSWERSNGVDVLVSLPGYSINATDMQLLLDTAELTKGSLSVTQTGEVRIGYAASE